MNNQIKNKKQLKINKLSVKVDDEFMENIKLILKHNPELNQSDVIRVCLGKGLKNKISHMKKRGIIKYV